RMFESMAELRREVLFLFQTFTVFKLLQTLAHRLNNIGRSLAGKPALPAPTDAVAALVLDACDPSIDRRSSSSSSLSSSSGHQPPRARRLWPFILFFVSAVCGPIIINRLWRLLKASTGSTDSQQEAFWDGQEILVRALYDFAGEGASPLR